MHFLLCFLKCFVFDLIFSTLSLSGIYSHSLFCSVYLIIYQIPWSLFWWLLLLCTIKQSTINMHFNNSFHLKWQRRSDRERESERGVYTLFSSQSLYEMDSYFTFRYRFEKYLFIHILFLPYIILFCILALPCFSSSNCIFFLYIFLLVFFY